MDELDNMHSEVLLILNKNENEDVCLNDDDMTSEAAKQREATNRARYTASERRVAGTIPTQHSSYTGEMATLVTEINGQLRHTYVQRPR